LMVPTSVDEYKIKLHPDRRASSTARFYAALQRFSVMFAAELSAPKCASYSCRPPKFRTIIPELYDH
jgi:hypothetical protein